MLKRELTVPPGAQTASDATEVVRAWIANKGLHCSLLTDAWGDNEAIFWGILLSDVARHVADAIGKTHGTPPQETLAIIREHFNSELDAPTAETTGTFVE